MQELQKLDENLSGKCILWQKLQKNIENLQKLRFCKPPNLQNQWFCLSETINFANQLFAANLHKEQFSVNFSLQNASKTCPWSRFGILLAALVAPRAPFWISLGCHGPPKWPDKSRNCQKLMRICLRSAYFGNSCKTIPKICKNWDFSSRRTSKIYGFAQVLEGFS